jgi:predicted aspartyl protease
MSNENFELSCPACTVLNFIDTNSKNDEYYCSVCSSLLLSKNEDIFTQIKEADSKERVIQDNYLKAYNELPSSFIPANMIYLIAKIMGNEIKFLVDTGAQVSLLPLNVVKMCDLEHLMDEKYSGELKGVGSDRVMGRIHYLEVELECGLIPCSFTICEKEDIIPILGIDMMQQMGLVLNFKERKIEINNFKFPM